MLSTEKHAEGEISPDLSAEIGVRSRRKSVASRNLDVLQQNTEISLPYKKKETKVS